MSNAVFLNLLRTSLVVGVLTAVIAAAAPVWNRRFGACWKRRLWFVLAAVLLLGCFVQAPKETARVELRLSPRPLPVVQAEGGPSAILGSDIQAGWEIPGLQEAGAGENRAPERPLETVPDAQPMVTYDLDWLTVGKGIWLAGTVLLLLRAAVRDGRFLRQIRRWSRPVRRQELLELYGSLCAELGCFHPPEIMVWPEARSPMLTGLLRPKLVLPTEEYGAREAEWILRHELAHWRGRDLWLKALLLAAGLVHWFNPLVWLLRREAERDIERACDERVLTCAGPEDRRFYANVLLTAAARGRSAALSTCFYGGKKVLRERLVNILSPGKGKGAVLAVCCAIAAVCGVVLVACTVESGGEASAEEPSLDAGISAGIPESYTLAAAVSLLELEPYQYVLDGRLDLEPDVVPVDTMGEVLLEQELSSGVQLVCYQDPEDAFVQYWAIRQREGLLRFYREESDSGSGRSAEAFYGLFGCDGFRIETPLGASCQAFRYYYLDDEGIPRLLIECANEVLQADLNGDGEYELMWFYQGGGAGGQECYYVVWQDGALYQADVTAMLAQALPDWDGRALFSSAGFDSRGGRLYFFYSIQGDTEPHCAILKINTQAMEVYTAPERAVVDWQLNRGDKRVGLLSIGDQILIVMQYSEDVLSVLKVTDAGIAIQPFYDILGQDGFIVRSSQVSNYESYYYSWSGKRIARSWNWDQDDTAVDLDGNGIKELVCNVTYFADGWENVVVYRMQNGQIQAAYPALPLNTAKDRSLMCSYDPQTNTVVFVDRWDAAWSQSVPLELDKLEFNPFTSSNP